MGTASIFFTMWVAMMVAMMFPAAAPMVLMYARMRKSDPASVALFTGSYIALWIAFGGLAFGLGRFVEDRAASSMWFADNWVRLAAGLLIVAGIYQLTPLKDICLRHCRSPLGFVMAHWRDGRTGAVRMGARHGLFCVGCCWLLFLILVPLGVMNIAAMIVVTLLVFGEKVLPWGRVHRAGRGSGPDRVRRARPRAPGGSSDGRLTVRPPRRDYPGRASGVNWFRPGRSRRGRSEPRCSEPR